MVGRVVPLLDSLAAAYGVHATAFILPLPSLCTYSTRQPGMVHSIIGGYERIQRRNIGGSNHS